MPLNRSVEIPADLLASAAEAGKRAGVEPAEQIVRWVRAGREVESSADRAAVDDVLAGEASYDDLPSGEQAIVRAVWAERIVGTRGALDYEAAFTAAGESWTEADEDGQVIRRP
jgi:hypothetical protein